MRVLLCFRTFTRSLARTVTGNLLVSLMRDLMSVAIQGLCKMCGGSNDHSRVRGYMLERDAGRLDIIAPIHSLSEEIWKKNLHLHATFLRWKSCCSHQSVGIKEPSQGSAAEVDTESWVAENVQQTAAQPLSQNKCTLNKDSGRGSAIFPYSWGYQMHWSDTCSPTPHSLWQSPAQPCTEFVGTL